MFDRRRNTVSSDGRDSDTRYRVRGIVQWLDDDGCFRIGKYEGEALTDIAEDDPRYLEWIVESAESINEEERETVQEALEGMTHGREQRYRDRGERR